MEGVALVDVRSVEAFVKWHVPYSTHIPFRGDEPLCERLHELPALPCELRVLAEERDVEEVKTLLERRGYGVCVVDEVATRKEGGETGRQSVSLWRPSPLVQQALPLLLAASGRSVLDIGCGAGRDAAFLARHGFAVLGVDRDRALVEKMVRFGRREQRNGGRVEGTVRTFGRHLGEDRAFLREHAADVLVVVRFLRRGVLDMLWEAVKPDGYIIYEHFLVGSEKLGGPNKPSQLLRPGELSDIFTCTRGFTVQSDLQTNLSDGRPVARFMARRDKL